MFRMSRRIALRKTATARPNEFNYSFRALAVGYELLTPPDRRHQGIWVVALTRMPLVGPAGHFGKVAYGGTA